jgi:hypothetical protein
MKFSHFFYKIKIGSIEKILIYKSPDNLTHWFPMIKTDDLKLHILVDEQELPITNTSIDNLLIFLKNAGAKKVEVIL